MEIRLYNTLHHKKETFMPIKPGVVGLYTCGPTVYSRAHIGNFRTFLFEDVLKRTLKLVGYNVHHVMNITDVDDKTIKKANEQSCSLSEITTRYTAEFIKDMSTLKIESIDKLPKATDHIQEMINLIKILLNQEIAYKTDDGSVFFAIEKYSDYGALVNLDFHGQKPTDRVAADEYNKNSPQDFALWKSWKKDDGQVYWDSPWGRGRPGWHIECSAMSTKYLGNHFDIHCGGVDNIFPHHENEIAQSCGALETPFVNFWLHSEHLVLADEKMSKSLGNIQTIPDLLDQGYSPETIRFALISSHYRSKLVFSLAKLDEAKQLVKRIHDTYKRLIEYETDHEDLPLEYENFMAALVDDLNTPRALGVFFNYIRDTNRMIANNELSADDAGCGKNFIESANSVFGVLQESGLLPSEITNIVLKREQARKDKNWVLADKLREELKNSGWIVEDTTDGSKCYHE